MINDGAAISSVTTAAGANPLDNDAIPEKPTQFNLTSDDCGSKQESVVNIKRSTVSSIIVDDEIAYKVWYLSKIGGVAL